MSELKSYVPVTGDHRDRENLIDTRICGLCGHHGTELVTALYPPAGFVTAVVGVGYCSSCLRMPAGEFLRKAGEAIGPAFEPPPSVDPPVIEPFYVVTEEDWKRSISELTKQGQKLAAVRKELRELKGSTTKPKKKKRS